MNWWPFKTIPSTGAFRTPQSFTILSAHHLLDKLAWDMQQLEVLRWEEDLGKDWRRVVSYKAVDCATTIWHLAEWFVQDIAGSEPRERACAFLGIEGHDPWLPIPINTLRTAALKLCPELELCRVVAVASKHYEVTVKPRVDIRTNAYESFEKRGTEPFLRPVMWLAVYEQEVMRDMRQVLRAAALFWNQLNFVARPGSDWKPGDSTE